MSKFLLILDLFVQDSDDFFGKEDDSDYADILDELLYNYEEGSDVGDRRSQEEDPETPIAVSRYIFRKYPASIDIYNFRYSSG